MKNAQTSVFKSIWIFTYYGLSGEPSSLQPCARFEASDGDAARESADCDDSASSDAAEDFDWLQPPKVRRLR